MDQYPDISPEELELIERFLTGQLDGPEKETFEQNLRSSETLRLQVEEVKLLLTGIRETALQASLHTYHQELAPAVKEVPRIGYMKRWLVAASVIAVIGIAIWFVVSSRSGSNSLYMAYYEKDPGLLSAMSTVAGNYEFDRAMINYKEGKNEEAIKTWELQLATAPANDTLNYFLGSAYLSENKPDKAIEYFRKVIAKGQGEFLNEAYWYAGLAFLSKGNKEEAIALISQSDRKEKDELLVSLRN